MRLYLSSYRMGDHIGELKKLCNGTRVAVIENATDMYTSSDRAKYRKEKYDIFNVFNLLDFSPEALDLRNFFNRPKTIHDYLSRFDLLWVCGGNTFILRRAMAQSGFDKAIKTLLENDTVVYGGWSAGICVLAPSLEGLELCDDETIIPENYSPSIIWDGLNIVDCPILPHYKSDHPESSMVDDVVQYYKDRNISHHLIRDGDVLIKRGSELELLKFEQGQTTPLNNDGVSKISWRP